MSSDSIATSNKISAPDLSARAGLFLGAVAVGSSFQPNLLTRGTRDQAIISGLSAAAGYGAASAGHSLLVSIGMRVRGGDNFVFESVLTGAGLALMRYLPPQEHESSKRALTRLGGLASAALGSTALASRLARRISARRSPGGRVAITAGLAVATSVATYLATRPRQTEVGALMPDGSLWEDSDREVKPAIAVGVAGAVSAALVGFATLESYGTRQTARAAAFVLGGEPADHRTLGRVVTLGATVLLGRAAISKVVGKLEEAGDSLEAAHEIEPTLAEVTGSPQSHVAWADQSREGRRWLSMVLLKDNIAKVMGGEAAQPIRVYASMPAAASDEERAALLLRELERTNAFDRSVLALFSPTGSGYVNYVASETLEYLSRGDCASACIEYSVLPSSLSLTAVPMGSRQTRLVLDRIVERLLQMPAAQRPHFVLFGESLGSQVSQDMFTGQGIDGPRSAGLDAAVWIGTPNSTKWRKQLWGDRSVTVAPEVGPDSAYLPRSIADWRQLPDEDRARIRYLLLQNGDDPIPKFGEPLIWEPPDWLGPTETRPLGAPRGTHWVPFVTFVQTFIDMMNALTPTPGVFAEGGHDYRVIIPEALNTVWRLGANEDEMSRVQQVLRERELAWEVARKWDAAEAIEDLGKRAKQEQKVEQTVASWLASSATETTTAADEVTPAKIEEIIAEDSQPS